MNDLCADARRSLRESSSSRCKSSLATNSLLRHKLSSLFELPCDTEEPPPTARGARLESMNASQRRKKSHIVLRARQLAGVPARSVACKCKAYPQAVAVLRLQLLT